MCKMMNKALDNYFGAEVISEINLLVAEDDAWRASRLDQKNRRAARVERNKDQKERNKRLYNPFDVAHWSNKAEFNEFRGICPVFHGKDEPVAFIKKSRKNGTKQVLDKIENRKVRYQKFTEPLPELPVTGEVTLYEEWNDWDEEFACHPERFEWHVEDYHIVIDRRVDPDDMAPTLYFDDRVGRQLDEAEDAIKKFWLDKVIRLERERAAYQAKIHTINRQLKKLYVEGAESDYDEVLD